MDTATAGQLFMLTCTVFSGGPSEVSWIDPDGVIRPIDGEGVSYYNISDRISILELTFQSILTSQSGLYKCNSNIAFPPSKSEVSFLIQVRSKYSSNLAIVSLHGPKHLGLFILLFLQFLNQLCQYFESQNTPLCSSLLILWCCTVSLSSFLKWIPMLQSALNGVATLL